MIMPINQSFIKITPLLIDDCTASFWRDIPQGGIDIFHFRFSCKEYGHRRLIGYRGLIVKRLLIGFEACALMDNDDSRLPDFSRCCH